MEFKAYVFILIGLYGIKIFFLIFFRREYEYFFLLYVLGRIYMFLKESLFLKFYSLLLLGENVIREKIYKEKNL